jgi:hypothetical protein
MFIMMAFMMFFMVSMVVMFATSGSKVWSGKDSGCQQGQ